MSSTDESYEARHRRVAYLITALLRVYPYEQVIDVVNRAVIAAEDDMTAPRLAGIAQGLAADLLDLEWDTCRAERQLLPLPPGCGRCGSRSRPRQEGSNGFGWGLAAGLLV